MPQPVPAAQQGVISDLAAGADERRRGAGAGGALVDPLARSEQEEPHRRMARRTRRRRRGAAGPTLLAAGLGPRRRLAELLEPVPPATLPVVMRWIGAILRGVELAEEIEDASGRISDLVSAVKEYSYLDRGAEQEIDLHDGLESTLTMLGHKIGQGIEVVREYDPDAAAHHRLRGRAQPGLDEPDRQRFRRRSAAVGAGDTSAPARRDHVLVLVIATTAPASPGRLQMRIWEPFFTTKTDRGGHRGWAWTSPAASSVGRHRGDMRL